MSKVIELLKKYKELEKEKTKIRNKLCMNINVPHEFGYIAKIGKYDDYYALIIEERDTICYAMPLNELQKLFD